MTACHICILHISPGSGCMQVHLFAFPPARTWCGGLAVLQGSSPSLTAVRIHRHNVSTFAIRLFVGRFVTQVLLPPGMAPLSASPPSGVSYFCLHRQSSSGARRSEMFIVLQLQSQSQQPPRRSHHLPLPRELSRLCTSGYRSTRTKRGSQHEVTMKPYLSMVWLDGSK